MADMNALDRAIAWVSPRRAMQRLAARSAIGDYEAARHGKRRVGLNAKGGSANTAIGLGLGPLRDRARHLVRNTPHGSAMVERMTSSLVGTGITPLWNTGSDALDRKVSLLWEEWAKRADAEEENDYYAQQALSVRAMIEGGEMLTRFVDLKYGDDKKVPFRLQLLEGDHIDSSRDSPNIDGRRVRLGVALDAPYNRRAGYYLFSQHPGEQYGGANFVSRFTPRDEVRHLMRPLRIGQVRGVSWLAPLLLPAADLADLMRNTIVKTGVEAAFAGYLTNTGGGGINLGQSAMAGSGDREWLAEPGQLIQLQAGQDIKFAEPKTSTQFQPIEVSTIRAMAVGIGLTYDQASGDLTGANYSSLRAGKIEHRRLVEQVQHHTIIPRSCDPVAERFISRCILAGTLRDRADGYPRDWVPPANEPIDPKKDLEADIAAVRAGRLSPQEFIGMWGRDWKKVVADTGAFWEAMDKAKMTFDIDPRKPLAGSGGASAADAATENAGNAASEGGTAGNGGDGKAGDDPSKD
jgi:lambda family phage portal protein